MTSDAPHSDEPAPSPFDVERLTQQVHAALRGARPIDPALARPAAWGDAVQALIAAGQLEAAGHALPTLRAAYPGHAYFTGAAHLLELVPPSDGSEFTDERTTGCQVVPFEGSDTVLFSFVAGGRMGLPTGVVHRWLRRLGVHLVYLRDRSGRLYLRGVEALGGTYEGTLDGMHGVARELGASRILCMGLSNSGYAALRYGLDLKAAAALSFSPVTHLPPGQVAPAVAELRRRGATDVTEAELAGMDLKPKIIAAGAATRLRIVFGEANPADRMQAEHVRDLPGVSLGPLPIAGHNALYRSVLSGDFDSELAWLTERWADEP